MDHVTAQLVDREIKLLIGELTVQNIAQRIQLAGAALQQKATQAPPENGRRSPDDPNSEGRN